MEKVKRNSSIAKACRENHESLHGPTLHHQRSIIGGEDERWFPNLCFSGREGCDIGRKMLKNFEVLASKRCPIIISWPVWININRGIRLRVKAQDTVVFTVAARGLGSDGRWDERCCTWPSRAPSPSRSLLLVTQETISDHPQDFTQICPLWLFSFWAAGTF